MKGMYTSHINGWRREDQDANRASQIAAQPNFSDLKQKMGSYIPSNTSNIQSDLRSFSPTKRHDQLTSQSCVANSITRALENKRIQKAYADSLAQGLSTSAAMVLAQSEHIALSRMALYFLCREEMDPPETNKDEGTIISIAAELLRTFGLARETQDPNNTQDRAYWPFDLNKVFVAPSWAAMREASLHKIHSWARITSTGNDRVDDVIANLAVGNPVVFGTLVDTQWSGYNDGIIIPANGNILGRHATMLCGWDPSGFFWDENSWGNGWGLDGFCKLSSDVIAAAESSDFIVISGGWEEWHQVSP